jgi:predicted Zn finger-like uncharacterized protein
MRITCPTCGTSYGINPATLGPEGRIVRCARCKEVWHVAQAREAAPAANAVTRPHEGDAHDGYLGPAHAAREADAHDARPVHHEDTAFSGPAEASEAPVVESPPIAAGWHESEPSGDPRAHHSSEAHEAENHRPAFGRKAAESSKERPAWLPLPFVNLPWLPRINLPRAVMAMAAVAIGLLVWRADIVRLMPQTATFYKLVGFGVNLRGLDIVDIKTTTETVDGRPVIVIEGTIIGVGRNAVEVPRLRFVVRDARGADLYAWNAVLEQSTLRPGEKAWFRSRLAAPPAEAREIAVRFFNRRDVSTGAT